MEKFNTFNALIKLSRAAAIFEFSSSNGLSSFTLTFECRNIQIMEMRDANQSHFAYSVLVRSFLESSQVCEERGYETGYQYDGPTDGVTDCITTFQGSKCSMI